MLKQNIKAREIALEILYDVLYDKKYSNELLSTLDEKFNLLKKDKTLIFKIVYGTLQNKIFLEFIISSFVKKNKTDKKIWIILLLSLYQLHFLNKIPPYAIVNEAVNIAKKYNKKAANMVNAVLKKIIVTGDILKYLENSKLSKMKKVLIKNSMPEWIFNLLKNNFKFSDIQKFISDNTSKPKLSYRVNTNRINYEKFVKYFSDRYIFVKSDVTKTGIISKNPLIKTSLFNEGYIIAQDEMSQKIVEILDPKENDFILDMCASPGGKTTHISQLMNNTGHIDAFDISRKKTDVLSFNIQKLNCENISVHTLDVNNHKPTFLYDKILLDPPCSGLGVIKRKPEIKYQNINKNKFIALQKIQEKLLDSAYKLLKENGILVYSTCTVNFYENENQIKHFLDKYSDMKIIIYKQIFGFEENTDGFYYCKLIKTRTKQN